MSQALTPAHERILLAVARRAVERHLDIAAPGSDPDTNDPLFKEKRGAFVTLKAGGELRGCIGYPLPVKPLDETIAEMAVAAASEDFRFTPLTAEELEETTIEISVLSLPRPVASPEEVEVGRHGIIVAKGSRRGLLLPQVPLEYGWDREEFLRHGCLKAGLPGDEWKKGARIEVFEARVFSEKP
jgi:AmmeMemoRadiSam system protein A